MPPSPTNRAAAVPPPPAFMGRPPLANSFPSTSSQSVGALDSVDSKEYLRDILNLSVDLDPDDDVDDTSVPIQVSGMKRSCDSFMNIIAYWLIQR